MTKQKQKRPTHNWAVDQDYFNGLSASDKAWLSQFNSEYYYGSFTPKRKSIHPEHLKADCRHRKYKMTEDAMTGSIPLNDLEASDPSALPLVSEPEKL